MADWRRDEIRNMDSPEPGFYALKLVKKGPEVGGLIAFLDGLWVGSINSSIDGCPNTDPQLADNVQRIWLHGRRIDQSEYNYLLARYQHAVAHDPSSPFANPERPISLRNLPPIGR